MNRNDWWKLFHDSATGGFNWAVAHLTITVPIVAFVVGWLIGHFGR